MRVARSRTRTISPAASLMLRRLAGDADQHLVAGGGVERLVFADEDFRLEDAVDGVRADEAVPGCVRRKMPVRVPCASSGAECVVAAEREPAGADQFADGLAELGVCSSPRFSRLNSGLRLDRGVALGRDRVQDCRQEIGHAQFSRSNAIDSSSLTLRNRTLCGLATAEAPLNHQLRGLRSESKCVSVEVFEIPGSRPGSPLSNRAARLSSGGAHFTPLSARTI